MPNTFEQQVSPALTTVMDGAVAVLSMGLAPYNLMDRNLNHELVEGLEWARREGARAVVLRSSLRHFSAGADLDAMIADAGVSLGLHSYLATARCTAAEISSITTITAGQAVAFIEAAMPSARAARTGFRCQR